MKKLKVLIINALFEPFTGGVEKHLIELSRALVKRGVEVHVMTGRLKGTKAEEIVDGIKVHRIPCTEVKVPGIYPPPLIVAPGAYNEARKLDEKHDFDIIHLQDRWFTDFSVAAAYAKQAKKPLVITLHNARTVGIAPHYTIIGGLFDIAIGRQTLAMADKIISVSKWAIGDVGKVGLSPKRFVFIPNGIDTTKLSPRKDNGFKQRHGLGTGPMALFVGRLIKQKGLEYLIAAWKNVSRKHPQARLVIIGRGNELAKLQALVAKNGIEKTVYFPGYVSEEELYQALYAADVFVLPSLWEVLPIAILEAMAAGKPVVCSDVGGNSELVHEGKNGLLVPKRNPHALEIALDKVLGNAQLRQRMGRYSRKLAVNQFDWKIVARQTHEFYLKLLQDYKQQKTPDGTEMAVEDIKHLSDEFRKDSRKSRSEATALLKKYSNRVKTAFSRLSRT